MFEAVTLAQTGKAPATPIVLVDEAYWRRIVDWDALGEVGTIGARDLGLIRFAADAEAWGALKAAGIAAPAGGFLRLNTPRATCLLARGRKRANIIASWSPNRQRRRLAVSRASRTTDATGSGSRAGEGFEAETTVFSFGPPSGRSMGRSARGRGEDRQGDPARTQSADVEMAVPGFAAPCVANRAGLRARAPFETIHNQGKLKDMR
jgi:hypothetical protein